MRFNPVVFAARYAGRPLLMRSTAVEAYAHELRALDPSRGRLQFERPVGRFGAFFSRAKAALAPARAPEAATPATGDQRPSPEAYWPVWLEDLSGEPDDEGFGWALCDGIALIDISGPLMTQGFAYEDWDGNVTVYWGYDLISRALGEIAADERVKAVFVHYDTPGGIAGDGLIACAAQLRALRQLKPVWGFCETACSAGYWLAASGGRLIASQLGLVGSIGAVITHCDMSGALAKDGFTVQHIQFGAKKTDGSPYKPLSTEAQADLQAEIDELGAIFVRDVVAGRPSLSAETVIATQAGVFLGQHSDPARSAVSIGLIDAVMTEPEAFAELQTLVQTSGARSAVQPQPAAAAASTTENKPMRRSALRTAAAKVGIEDTKAVALAAAIKETADDDIDNDDADPDDPDADPEDPEKNPDGEPEATKIAASPEAAAHPQLAMAAIASGQTLAQFKASAAATPKVGKLAAQMQGAPRLGADSVAEPGTVVTAPGRGAPAKLDHKAIYDRRAQKPARGARA